MTNYRRYRLKGGCYFFTVPLAERRSRLLTKNIRGIRIGFREVKQAHPFAMEAVVIWPDHLHCLWTLPERDDDFSTRWRQIKAAYSRQLPATERRSKSRVQKGERGYLTTAHPGGCPTGAKRPNSFPTNLWQRRFWEHAIRDAVGYHRHVDYIHYNPVKHGLVGKVADWPHSTFHRYVRQGIYGLDRRE